MLSGRLLVSCLRGLGSFEGWGVNPLFLSFFWWIIRMEVIGNKSLKHYTGLVTCSMGYTAQIGLDYNIFR